MICRPMSPEIRVTLKIVSMFLVILVGWVVRRRGLLDEKTTSLLSRFTTDIALPALVFTQMLISVDAQVLRSAWALMLGAAVILLTGHLLGFSFRRFFATAGQAPTFIFVVGVANWIYLPYPIVNDLYGREGIRQLLISNVGVQVVLWTVGIAILEGRFDGRAAANVLKNPGLLATLAGIAAALMWPDLVKPDATATWGTLSAGALISALDAIGSLTIPLSLILIGAQLGGMRLRGPRPNRALAGIILLRLLAVPLVMLAAVWLLQLAGVHLPVIPVMVGLIIASMPVAVSCSILTERYRQDTNLAAQSILYTTLISIVTCPLLFGLARRVVGT